MRYWKHKETQALLSVDLQMVPNKWVEITKEDYENCAVLRESERLDNTRSGKHEPPKYGDYGIVVITSGCEPED